MLLTAVQSINIKPLSKCASSLFRYRKTSHLGTSKKRLLTQGYSYVFGANSTLFPFSAINTPRNYSTSTTSFKQSEFYLPLFKPAFDEKLKDKVGFTDYRGVNLTYSQLGSKSLQLAQQLKDLIGENESQVVFLCPHDSSFLVTVWACWMANHVAVPLSDKHPENLLEYFAKHTDAKVIVTTEKYADQMNKLAKAVNIKLHVVDFDSLSTTPVKAPSKTYGNSDNALILFTSGTTGMPKGVLLTHQNLLAQMSNICEAWQITSRDTLLHVLPLHHTHGLIHALLSPLFVGARCQMLEKFNGAQAWKELLSNEVERPNILMGVPTVYSKLVEEYDKTYANTPSMVEFVKQTCLNKMRVMISGSAALPVPVIEKWETLTGHRLLERYGMTEIGMALTNPYHGERKPGFVGSPFESVRVRVADLVTRDKMTVLAEGGSKGIQVLSNDKTVIGDLLIKGPSVFKEYIKNPEATKKEFTNDGWFITGDTVQYIDGKFKILGRKSVDIIKSGGYKLSALEIETQLLALEEIHDVSVVGLPDPVWGQKVAAMIVWKGDELSLDNLREIAKKRLPPYACPTQIQTIDKLPKNQLGKVNKKELVKLFK